MVQTGFKRKLTAILSADVEGYSRLMDDDEGATVRTLTAYRTAITDLVQPTSPIFFPELIKQCFRLHALCSFNSQLNHFHFLLSALQPLTPETFILIPKTSALLLLTPETRHPKPDTRNPTPETSER